MVFGIFGDRRIVLLLITAAVVLLFVVVNSSTLRQTAIIYLAIVMTVLLGLPIMRRLVGR